jgi:predicted aldo/keto reductase-like oxidoreductase
MASKSQISTKYLTILRNALPFRAISDIAEKFNLDPSTVSKVLSGSIKNDEVLDEAIQIAEAHKAELEQKNAEREQRIKALKNLLD